MKINYNWNIIKIFVNIGNKNVGFICLKIVMEDLLLIYVIEF